MVGEEYGNKLIPKSFDRHVFSSLLKHLKSKDVDLNELEAYYKLNVNCSPNKYELIDIKIPSQTRRHLSKLIKKAIRESDNNGIYKPILDELNQSSNNLNTYNKHFIRFDF